MPTPAPSNIPITAATAPHSGLHSIVCEFPNHPFNFGTVSDDILIIHGAHRVFAANFSGIEDSNSLLSSPEESLLRARVSFVARRLALIPKQFAEHAQTMFIHRAQFQKAHSTLLQDALSMSALHSMKSTASRAMVHEILQQKTVNLTHDFDPSNSSSAALLAALQALLLYQIMRLFDGDISLRASAEADQAIIISWANELESRRLSTVQQGSSTAMLMHGVGPVASSDWELWLLEESIKRTTLTCLLLKGIYDYLKLGYDSPVDLRVYFTAQQALGNAQSHVGWWRAWEQEPALEIAVQH